jgi:hypothetical protein
MSPNAHQYQMIKSTLTSSYIGIACNNKNEQATKMQKNVGWP